MSISQHVKVWPLAFALAGLIGALAAAHAHAQSPAPPIVVRSRGTPPTVRVFRTPEFWGSYAIWGATGADRRGHIWVGVTSNDDGSASAHLYEFDPATSTFTDRGNVLAELERLKIRRPGEKQMKIHSRIVEAPDGYLYFASMDESGEDDNGSKLPTWGGHLWRMRNVAGAHWEHLAATPEALIAVAGAGSYIYAEGYFNHVLYQFDTRTRKVRSVTVGAAGGHVSRNFFVDARGHAFVARVTEGGNGRLAAFLVEYDTDLTELGATPLTEYFERGRDDSHGIVSVHPGSDGHWYFATGKGRLYEMIPATAGPAAVRDLGWFHPAGSRYVATMFRDEQSGALFGVALPGSYGGDELEFVRRLPEGRAAVSVFPFGDAPKFPAGALVYGSMTRDADGRFYAVGTMSYKPFVLQITPAPQP
ncbi:MAG: hypothetical protein JSU08_16135 [Acidobacteria bacterium]|nr:hypothetical protein [Acidobacteriota bacterium]